MPAICPFCKKELKRASSLKGHLETFHTGDQADHVSTVMSRGAELVGGGWDPYEHTLMPKWDDARYPRSVAPVAKRGVWDDDPESINALYDPRSTRQIESGKENPHKPNWEPFRHLTETVRNPDSNGRLREVFSPTWANRNQAVRGMPVIRREGERFS